MKAFQFPLDRALKIRRIQQEIERGKLQTLTRDREQLDLSANAVRAEAANTRSALSDQPVLPAIEMSTMPDYQRGAAQRIVKLQLQKQDLLRQIVDQQNLTLEADRKVKLMERLRSQRLAEWESQVQKEQENFAADAYLARWASLSASQAEPQTPRVRASPAPAVTRR